MSTGPAMARSLRRLGVVRTERVGRALESLPDGAFAPPELFAFRELDVPWPEPEEGRFVPSARILVLFAELLELETARRVLVTPEAPTLLRGLLEAAGIQVAKGDGSEVDRALIVDGDWLAEDAARRRIRDGGFLLRIRTDPYGEGVVKYVRDGETWVRIGLNGIRLEGETVFGPEDEEAGGVSLHTLLVLEGIQRRVWRPEAGRQEDEHLAQSVDRIWSPSPPPDGRPQASERILLAKKLFHLGYIQQVLGDLGSAGALYAASCDAYATSEAYTFRSWVTALQGDIDGAIEGCRRAIAVDPAFGNPYNDMGAYLLEKGHAREAISWLERAKRAKRYQARHYAFTNSGRAWLVLGEPERARKELEEALRMAPGYEPAKRLLDRMDV